MLHILGALLLLLLTLVTVGIAVYDQRAGRRGWALLWYALAVWDACWLWAVVL